MIDDYRLADGLLNTYLTGSIKIQGFIIRGLGAGHSRWQSARRDKLVVGTLVIGHNRENKSKKFVRNKE